MFIQYRYLDQIPPEWIKRVQENDEELIEKLKYRECILNAITSYYLKNGKPLSSIKRMVFKG
jgi:hypothetical protein